MYAYDNAGNIENRKEYAYTTGTLGTVVDTIDYVYGDTNWGDLLTKYDGQSITYDNIGNPTSYYNGTRWSMTWEHGRELATISDGTTTWTNTYNADGLRTKRTNGTKTYEYIYLGDKLIQMNVGDDVLKFGYDANGSPMYLQFNNSRYFYATNVQGDVMALVHTSGTAVVEYTYDAWGNILTTTGSMAATLGQINPLRYRGYVYDTETGLYYLQSRYYDPIVGRFLNADALVSTGQGLLGNNMFAYCGNNPVIRADATGYGWYELWQEIKEWLEKKKEDANSNDDGTATLGVTVAGAFGVAGSVSVGVTLDLKGNVGISGTGNLGGGLPSAGVGGFVAVTNAPTIHNQGGIGTAVGGSVGPGVVAIGADYNLLVDSDAGTAYHGVTLTATGGLYPSAVELHGEAGYTVVKGFNLFDVLIDAVNLISNINGGKTWKKQPSKG